MVQAIPRSKARLTERQQFWLDHLRVCREQGHRADASGDRWPSSRAGDWCGKYHHSNDALRVDTAMA